MTIKQIRESKHLTQQQVADAVGITSTAYARIERGEAILTECKYSTVIKLISVLGEEILGGTKTMEENIMSFDCNFFTRDKESGIIIDGFITLDEAKEAIREYEAEDKADGSYTDDFYEIVAFKDVAEYHTEPMYASDKEDKDFLVRWEGNYMICKINFEVRGTGIYDEQIRLYAEVDDDADIKENQQFIDENGEFDLNKFDEYSYLILKEQILEQAQRYRITPDRLEFHWD